MTAVDTERLRELIAGIMEEGETHRGRYYEIYGSPITSLLIPLAELLNRNLETNPELVELVLLNFTQNFRGTGARMGELWARIDEKDEAASSTALPEYFAPKPMPSGIYYDPLGAAKTPKLWRFYWDCGRQGFVESVFVATQAEIDAALGSAVYFGEILGKHSDVHGQLDAEDLTLLSDDPALVALFQEHVGSTGHSPLDYLEEDEEAEDY